MGWAAKLPGSCFCAPAFVLSRDGILRKQGMARCGATAMMRECVRIAPLYVKSKGDLPASARRLLFWQRRIFPASSGILQSGRLTAMSASMYIVVEGEDPGFDIFVNGHALARNEDALEKLAVRLGVKPLLEFFSADENSMALLLEEGAGDPEWARTLPPPQWFSPEDGLKTICSLYDFLREAPMALGADTAAVIAELSEYERVLRKAALRNLRWQLAVSWK
jgi:hypothetical protein